MEIDFELNYSFIPQVLLSLLYIVSIACNPFIYLAFNTDIRKHFFQMFCCKNDADAVTFVRNTTIMRRER